MNGKWVEKIKKVEELASQYERHPLCMAYKPKLAKPWQPSSVWRLFPRQALAFNFAKTQKADVHVFALETVIDDTERRLFLVTTYTEFWFYYVKHYKTLAHCYEIIPAETVCKLYFDLEFYISANPGADGQKMVALVIEYFSNKLEECYDLKCSTDCVLNLDSSTKEKFSRHLIFVFQDAAFKDNIHVGNFVKGALQPVFHLIEHKLDAEITCETHISTKDTVEVSNLIPHHGICTAKRNFQKIRKKEYDLSSLIVKDKDGSNRLFIDLGVYTKNRNFRLYKSSKLGKNVPFKVAEDNTFIPKPQKYISAEESLFLSSLVSNVRFSDTMKILICVSPENDKNRSACLDHESKNVPGIIMKGYQFSPYPEIDYFILSIVTRDGFQGGIRQWNYFFSEELLVYDTVNYRWCENIGRSHKSNNVMLLVNLKGEHWYQKCYDPVCRAQNFKSNSRVLSLVSMLMNKEQPIHIKALRGHGGQIVSVLILSYPLPSEICLHFLFKEDDEEFFYSMDENGNIKETKVNMHSHAQEMLSAKKSEDFTSCERDWDSGIDDACILEATEDVELADALDKNMSDLYCEDKEIPDELLLQALNEYDMFMKN